MARNPSRIGRYDLITALATGGMGRIYLGRAACIGGFERKVVIKTLEVPLSAESDPAIAMFLDEARLLGLLHHQHIASVFEVGRDDDGRHYMVLEYLEGYSAHDVWERAVQQGTALPLDFTLTVVSAAANALHYAHTRKGIDGSPLGIVHRDVTPSNVMLGYDGAIKLIDFGIAMAQNRNTKTLTGFVKGKVGYLSPEQVGGRDVDARTDVFALGILLYELSTLHRAFRDTSDLATMQRIKQGKVARPSLVVRDYPMELEAIVMKALQVDPRDRFGDADAMRRAVEALGHRLHFVLGDAAVIEVMAQLFEPQPTSVAGAGAAKDRAPTRLSEAEFEWLDSDHDLTVRRDPKELLEAMRAESARLAEEKAKAAGSPPSAERPRKLRAATEAADALIVQSVLDTQGAWTPLPLASPPPTPVQTAQPAADKPVVARPATAVPPPPPKPAPRPAPPAVRSTDTPVIGASVVQARKQGSPLRWIAAVAVAAILAVIGYFITKESPSAVAGSPTLPVVPAASARTPPVPSPAPKPAHPDPPPPPPPTEVRVRIVSHPADATVVLDGKKLGRTPFDDTLKADPGKHVVKLRRRGYATYKLDLELGADVTEDVTLVPGK